MVVKGLGQFSIILELCQH